MNNKLTASLLAITMFLSSSPVNVHASTYNESELIKIQAEAIIDKVDESALMLDAMENVIDESVPISVREQIEACVEFIPADGDIQDAVDIDVNYTVQKVGEVMHNGESLNMYVAAATTETKEDSAWWQESGVWIRVCVYWIDNLGPSNQLVSAEAWWDPGDVAVKNRKVQYGVVDLTGTIMLDCTTDYPTENHACYENLNYVALCVGCKASIEVINVGTVSCSVKNGPLT